MRAFEFLKEQVIDEAPLPSDWDAKAFGPKSSFKSRLAYALERAKELGRGSSRVAMTIEYQGKPTALKVALNKKGLAQNEVEKDILMSNYARSSNMVIPIIDYDKKNKQPAWIQTAIAKPATTRQLCNLIGCLSLTHLVDMAIDIAKDTPDAVKSFIKTMKEQGKSKEEIESTYQYALLLSELNRQFDLLLNDFKFQDNWGLIKGKPVLIDLGFTTEVMVDYYESNEFINEEVLDEMPLPSDWDSRKFGSGSTFDERLEYALNRAKELGRGSSRVAMTIQYKGRPTALKVAMSQKGLAQNEVEKDILGSDYATQSGLLIPLIDYDKENKQPIWIQTELAKMATAPELCKIIGCMSLTHLVSMAWDIVKDSSRSKIYLRQMRLSGKTQEEMDSTLNYAEILAGLRKKFRLELDEFRSAENWGLVSGRPVLIDVGYNHYVKVDHYYR
jgi:predicted Ser/Thr protein kinase